MPKYDSTDWDGVKTHIITIFRQLDALGNMRTDRNTWLQVPSGTYVPPAATPTKWLKYERRDFSKLRYTILKSD